MDINDIVTELNNKADRDQSNSFDVLSASARQYFSSASMGGGTPIELTWNPVESTSIVADSFIAPDTGLFIAYLKLNLATKSTSVFRVVTIHNSETAWDFQITNREYTAHTDGTYCTYIIPAPVSKGDIYVIRHTNIVTAGALLKFIPAIGLSSN